MRIPMMPKGVEHQKCRGNGDLSLYVRIPMTPKGVEHMILNLL